MECKRLKNNDSCQVYQVYPRYRSSKVGKVGSVSHGPFLTPKVISFFVIVRVTPIDHRKWLQMDQSQPTPGRTQAPRGDHLVAALNISHKQYIMYIYIMYMYEHRYRFFVPLIVFSSENYIWLMRDHGILNE